MVTSRFCLGLICAVLAALLAIGPAGAQELRIGMKAAIDGSDPHLTYSPNRNVQLHVYEALVAQDAHRRPIAGLATAWRLLDPQTWEFALRAGAAFHDGTPVTPADVIFCLTRARAMKGIRTYGPALRSIEAMEVVDDRHLRIRTTGPTPMLFARHQPHGAGGTRHGGRRRSLRPDLAEGYIGHDPGIAVPRYDPPLARRLLAEAGFPQGFGLTLQCTA